MAISVFSKLPDDPFNYLGSFFSARELAPLFKTCKDLRDRCRRMFIILSTGEHFRMGMEFKGVPLTLGRVIDHFQELSLEKSRSIGIDLESQPLVFYPFNDARILLKETVRTAKGNDIALFRLVKKEKMSGTAHVLSQTIKDAAWKRQALFEISKKKDLSLEQSFEFVCSILEDTSDPDMDSQIEKAEKYKRKVITEFFRKKIAGVDKGIELALQIPSEFWKGKALFALSLNPQLPADIATEIVHQITHPEVSHEARRNLVFKKEMPLEAALKLAIGMKQGSERTQVFEDISLPRSFKKVFGIFHSLFSFYSLGGDWCSYRECKSVVLSKMIAGKCLEKAMALCQTIADQGTTYRTLYRIIDQRKDLPLDKGLEFAERIKDYELQYKALHILIFRRKLPKEESLKIIRGLSSGLPQSRLFYDYIKEDLNLNSALELAYRIEDAEWTSQALYTLIEESDMPLQEFLGIARRIPIQDFEGKALHYIALKEAQENKIALEIAHSIPSIKWKEKTLLACILKRMMPLEEAIEIAIHFTDEDLKNKALAKMAGWVELTFGVALGIVNRITNIKWKDDAYFSLVKVWFNKVKSDDSHSKLAMSMLNKNLKQESSSLWHAVEGWCKIVLVSVESLLDLTKKISDKNLKSEALALLADANELSFKKCLEIARSIPLLTWKNRAFYSIATAEEFPWNEALIIAHCITDEQMQNDAYKAIAFNPEIPPDEVRKIAELITDEEMKSQVLDLLET